MSGMKKWMIVLAIALIAALAAALIYWRLRTPEPAAYTPYPRDPLATEANMAGDIPALDAGAYTVGINPAPTLDEQGTCAIGFYNPVENQCFLMLDLRVKESGLLIYRTGLVAPGEGIAEIMLVEAALSALNGESAVAMEVHAFTLDTYEDMGDVSINGMLMEG